MDNHYHLLLETPDGNLSSAMRDVNGNYTQWFNTRHDRIGHVLQGRYKAYVIEKEPYLLEVVRYIVNNPVRANLVTHPKDWKWSSYRASAGSIKSSAWLETDFTLGLFSRNRDEAMREYRKFVKVGIGMESPYEEAKGNVLGSPQFIDWIWEAQTNGSEEIKEVPREERVVGRPTLEDIFSDVISREDRNAAIQFARFRCGYLASEIARHIDLDPSVVARISRGKYNQK